MIINTQNLTRVSFHSGKILGGSHLLMAFNFDRIIMEVKGNSEK